MSRFPSGVRPPSASASSMPSSRPTRRTSSGWSPERIRTRAPRARRAAMVSRASGRSLSPIPAIPATRPSRATKIGLRPSATNVAAAAARASGTWASPASTWARLPMRTSWPSSVPAMPCPGTSTTCSTVLTSLTGRSKDRWKARATACADSASRARANCSATSSPCQRATVGRPSVSVPVLSRSTVPALRSRSRASGFFTKIPERAARMSATDIASGIESPSAQGQATTRRATTRSSATAGPRCKPRRTGDGGENQESLRRSAGPEGPSSGARRASARAPPARSPAAPRRASSRPPHRRGRRAAPRDSWRRH